MNNMTEYDPTVCPYCEWWVPEGMEYMIGDHIQQCIGGDWPPKPQDGFQTPPMDEVLENNQTADEL